MEFISLDIQCSKLIFINFHFLEDEIDFDQFEKCKRRLQSSLNKNDKAELDSALSDFESTLKTEELRLKEKELLESAYDEKEYLRDLESMLGILIMRFKSRASNLVY